MLQDENELLVMLNPAPYRVGRKEGELNPFFDEMNIGWLDTTVFNCVYGWHYANIPALGIWRSVVLREIPDVRLEEAFLSTRDTGGGMELCVALQGQEGGFKGELSFSIEPENFQGKVWRAAIPVDSQRMSRALRLAFTVPEPRLWWPNGLGEQNLYRMRLAFFAGGAVVDSREIIFGIRTVEMRPCKDEAKEDMYNWQFVINGQKIFVKGANWCTLDFAMRFSKERYERFLGLARRQHLQFLRAWGGGMPETDEFYALCDSYGIMVLQEFPTAWDSQKVQPADVLREGVQRTVKRLRSHPSLVMWGGGNESARPTDAVIDMMGRLVYELDGTRPFHRNDPWGGSSHDYSVYWGRQDFDYNLSYKAPFIGEFGFASSPNVESVRKYCTEEDFRTWPPAEGGNVEYHTPVFNQKDDMAILRRYVPEFLPDESLDNMIVSTQMCQTTTLRHTLELARTRRPEAVGICYYKLTDVFPAVSWSTIDWYGVPKSSYYFVQDSLEPLHACLLLEKLNPMGEEQALPVYLLDDADELAGSVWTVCCRAYDGSLACRKEQTWAGKGSASPVKKLGVFALPPELAKEAPLLLTVELVKNGRRAGRTFYWLNYASVPGSLFRLPETYLELERRPCCAIVRNVGKLPAVGVHFLSEEISEGFLPEDNFFWLDPGEEIAVSVNRDDYTGVAAWNAADTL